MITSGLFSAYWTGRPVAVKGRPAEPTDNGLGITPSDWRWSLVFLPSEATTVCLVLWAAGRFEDIRILGPLTGAGALLAWCAVTVATAGLERRFVRNLVGLLRGVALGLGVAAVAWSVK